MPINDLPADVTQVDVAESLIERYPSTLRYSPESQRWLAFSESAGWRFDEYESIMQERAIDTLRYLETFAPDDLDKRTERRFRARRTSRARGMLSVGTMKSVATIASKFSSVSCTNTAIDASPELLGAPNGVVDLRTGALQAFDEKVIVTRRVSVAYDPNAKCPRWERFLAEVLGEDDSVQDYFHRLAGYLLTGETRQHQMWLLVGNGSNGKSTLVSTIMKVMGAEYSQQAAESVLLAKSNSGAASNDLVRLKGVRCAVLTETGAGQSLHEERVKSLVSADTITARGLYKEFEQFVPQAKYLLATNHLPVVRGSDQGIWRRLVVVPFLAHFEVGSDPTLDHDLEAELQGILSWAVAGATLWYAKGPAPVPTTWQDATDGYRAEQDAIKAFTDEHVNFENGLFVGATELYDTYVRWCVEDGRQSLTQSEFGQRFMATGLVTKRKKSKTNRYHYIGAALKRTGEAEVAAKLDGLFDGLPTTPPGPSFRSPDGPLTEVTP